MKQRILAGVVRALRMRRRFLVIFVPYDPYGERDAVAALAGEVRRRIPRFRKSKHLDRYVRSFEEVAQEIRISPPSRLVLFAHPCRAFTGFAVNPSPERFESLGPEWWNYPGAKYDLLIAHVCSGAVVLRRARYRQVFPNWISYRSTIEVYVGSKVAQQRWTEITHAIIEAGWECDNIDSATHRIRGIYENAMAQIHDNKNVKEGDPLTLVHLEGCLRALTSSTDYNGDYHGR